MLAGGLGTALADEGVTESKGKEGFALQGDFACVAGLPVENVMTDMLITTSNLLIEKQ